MALPDPEFLGQLALSHPASCIPGANFEHHDFGELGDAVGLTSSPLVAAGAAFLRHVGHVIRLGTKEEVPVSPNTQRLVTDVKARDPVRDGAVLKNPCEPMRSPALHVVTATRSKLAVAFIVSACPKPTISQACTHDRAVLIDVAPEACDRFFVQGEPTFLWAMASDVCASRGRFVILDWLGALGDSGLDPPEHENALACMRP